MRPLRLIPILLLFLLAMATVFGVAAAQPAEGGGFDLVQQVLIPLLLSAATYAVAWVGTALRTFLVNLAANQKNEAFKKLLEVVAETASTAVREIAQTAVNDLKAAHEDGKLTKAEAMAALQAAKDRAWSILSQQIKDQLLAIVGGSVQAAKDTFLTPAVEAEVALLDNLLPTADPITDPATKDRVLQLARARLNLA